MTVTSTAVAASRRSAGEGRSDHIQALARGLAVIRAFAAGRELTLTEVAHEAKLSKATARRCLLTLVDEGYARQTRRGFVLRPTVLELGSAYLSGTEISDVATPHVDELAAQTGEFASIAVLDDSDIVHVIVAPPPRRVLSVNLPLGSRFPAHGSSLGRVLLAALPQEEREQVLQRAGLTQHTIWTVTSQAQVAAALEETARVGYAVTDQEITEGVRSVAVPIRDSTGATVASFGLLLYTTRATTDDLVREYLPRLRSAAHAIELDLGFTAER